MKQLFENLFQLDWWGTFWTAAISVLAAWSVMLTAGLVLVNGSSRFRLPQLFRVRALHGWMALAAVAMAAPTMSRSSW